MSIYINGGTFIYPTPKSTFFEKEGVISGNKKLVETKKGLNLLKP